MTNIVTVVDSCDIVAIGVDFGVVGSAIPAGGVVSAVANTTTGLDNGNEPNGGVDHPNVNDDGEAGAGPADIDDDTLSITTPIGLLNGPVGTLLGTVSTALPGVYAACTSTPTAVTLTSPGTSASLSFPTDLTQGLAAGDTLAGQMALVNADGDAIAGGATLDYTLTFVGGGLSVPLGVTGLLPDFYLGAFTAIGTITGPATATPGFYTEVMVAQIDF